MLKFKFALPFVVKKFNNSAQKLYSKAIKQLQPALNLTTALDAKTEEMTIKSASNLIPDSVLNNPVQTEKIVASVGSTDKKVRGCIRRTVSKGKKGKRCGQSKPPQLPQYPGPPGGTYMVDKCGMYDNPKANSKKWRFISYTSMLFVLGLSILIFSAQEEKPKPEYIPYEYLYKRTKSYPWRDGKTSLFHGRNNLIPEEEKECLDKKAKEKHA